MLIELTCPAEESIEARHVEKSARYVGLADQARANGWTVVVLPVEVGARGYVAHSVRRCLSALGLPPSKCTAACKALSVVVARCSFAIWLARNCLSWDVGRELVVAETK